MTGPIGIQTAIRTQTAFNYATDSENRMHSDGGARRYGFRGGLVPGIGDYAYFVPTVMEALGHGWGVRGWMTVKLLRPVYDGDKVQVQARTPEAPPEPLSPEPLSLELLGPDGALCAVAEAGLECEEQPIPELEERDVPATPADRPEASLEVLPAGETLGSLTVSMNREALRAEWREHFGSAGELPDDFDGPHPAFYPDLANRILSTNVLLGPWIHTESRARHLDAPRWQETISVRGRVRKAFEKRGHEAVHLDVGFFGEDERVLAFVDHRAIIRPRVVESPVDGSGEDA